VRYRERRFAVRNSEQSRIPKSFHDLSRQAYPDIDRWTDVLSTVETYLDYLVEAGREADAELYLRDCEAQFKLLIAENRKNRVRTNLRVITTGVVTSILAAIARAW
jgi:hypothetical protein